MSVPVESPYAINTTWHPISYCFEVIADYCYNFVRKPVTLRFEASFEGLGATYTVHLRVIGKLVVDFIFVLIKLFSLGVTGEALRANIDWKSVFLKGVGQFQPNFHVGLVWDVPCVPFLHGALQLCRWQYSHEEIL